MRLKNEIVNMHYIRPAVVLFCESLQVTYRIINCFLEVNKCNKKEYTIGGDALCAERKNHIIISIQKIDLVVQIA